MRRCFTSPGSPLTTKTCTRKRFAIRARHWAMKTRWRSPPSEDTFSSQPQIPTLHAVGAHALERTHRQSKLPGDVELSGGVFELGAARDGAFVFDNEKWAHRVFVQPFRISRTAVTNREFLDFVESGGYARL